MGPYSRLEPHTIKLYKYPSIPTPKAFTENLILSSYYSLAKYLLPSKPYFFTNSHPSSQSKQMASPSSSSAKNIMPEGFLLNGQPIDQETYTQLCNLFPDTYGDDVERIEREQRELRERTLMELSLTASLRQSPSQVINKGSLLRILQQLHPYWHR